MWPISLFLYIIAENRIIMRKDVFNLYFYYHIVKKVKQENFSIFSPLFNWSRFVKIGKRKSQFFCFVSLFVIHSGIMVRVIVMHFGCLCNICFRDFVLTENRTLSFKATEKPRIPPPRCPDVWSRGRHKIGIDIHL